jgi:Fe2+ transport system protein FeoA
MSSLTNGSATSLCDLPEGTVCRVDAVSMEGDHAARMAGLGISAGRQVRIVRAGEPLVVQVYGSRIGLARALAQQVFVTPEAGR